VQLDRKEEYTPEVITQITGFLSRFFPSRKIRESFSRNVLSELGPLYHNYLFFNVHNQQFSGSYAPNQMAKSQIMLLILRMR
jgi:hypothetical protein